MSVVNDIHVGQSRLLATTQKIEESSLNGIIVFGEDWGVHPSSTQHLIRRIAGQRPVVWVDSIGLRRPRLSVHDVRRVWNKLLGRNEKRVDQALPELPGDRRLSPRTLPAPKGRLTRRLAANLLKRQLRKWRLENDFTQPILWTSLPTAVDMAGKLNESHVIYYAGDDFSALAGVDHDTIAKRERELAVKADLIIAASPNIAQRFPAKKTRVLVHGVDYKLFSTPQLPVSELDGRPTAGFYGSISEWFDQELLIETARRLPDWRFILIGSVETDVSKLGSVQNIELLGPRPHHELPRWSQHWQASLLPFIDNPQIRASNPLKLREYLAAGQPIVTTEFPALDGYRDLVRISQNVEDMVRNIIVSVEDTQQQDRRDRVAGETWERQAEKLAKWISELESQGA